MKTKTVLWIIGGIASIVALSSIIPFHENWTKAADEWDYAQTTLFSDACSNPAVKAGMGKFSAAICEQARITMSITPFVRAILNTFGGWNVFRQEWFILTLVSFIENARWYIVITLIVLVILVFGFGVRFTRSNENILPAHFVYAKPKKAKVQVIEDKTE